MSEQSVEIMERADQLSLALISGPSPVTRNVLLAMTSDFLSSPRPDRDRLRRIVKRVGEGSGGHVLRCGGYGEQIRAAAAELAGVIEEDWSNQELKTLLGWTARLLLVRREDRPQEKKATQGQPVRRREERPADKKPKSPGWGISKSSMQTLEQLKQKLEDKGKS
ncbi:MAG: hypothetical protein ABUT39_23720 [Acidobacteriota bacterium]